VTTTIVRFDRDLRRLDPEDADAGGRGWCSISLII